MQAVITSAVGSLLGLGYTPLNNIDPFNNISGLSAEPAIVQVTGTDGVARMIGATPTMFPDYFLTQAPDGSYTAGWLDLARVMRPEPRRRA